jgi:GH25 family lysozyme M1 (1,4-beta-N-acetylmuramidase)
MPRGIDVSKHNGDINWPRVAATGIKYAFTRVIDDARPRNADPRFAANRAGIKAAGLLRGYYHFFRPGRDNVERQANLFVSLVGALTPGDLQPTIDIEITDGLGANAILDASARWIDIVEARLGRQVIIYTFVSFWRDTLRNTTRFSDHPLWIADLQNVPPRVPGGFRTFTFHQHSFTGRVPGIPRSGPATNVDLDRFNGSMNGLRAFAGLPPLPAPDPSVLPHMLVATTGITEAAPARKAAKKGTKKSTKKGAKKSAKTSKAGAKKGAAKKAGAKKSPAKKRAAVKAAAKSGAKKRPSARKGPAKGVAKRVTKKAR